MDSRLCLGLLVCTACLARISGLAPTVGTARLRSDPAALEKGQRGLEENMKAFERHLEAGCASRRRELRNVKRRLENSLLEARFPSENLTIVDRHLQTLIFRIEPKTFSGLGISSDTLMQQSRASGITLTRHSMYFPRALVERPQGRLEKEVYLACVYLKASCLFQIFLLYAFHDRKNSSLLNDDILGATLGNMSIANLSEPVEIRFWHNHSLTDSNMTCVFWLEEAENDTAGEWSQDGCETHFSQEGVILCRCHHLTYFAVLLQISPATVEPALLGPLAYITDIGCGVSAAACLFTILLHLFSRKIQHDSTTKVHMNLLGALFLLNASFLGSKSLVQIKTPWVCSVAAISLHYSLLCSWTWMALEGFHLYMLLVRVYNSYIRRYLLKLCFVGWGVPGLAVMTIILLKNSIYGRHDFKISSSSNSHIAMCWITTSAVHHGSFVYLGTTMLFNVVVLTVVVWRLRQLRANPHPHQKKHFCKDILTVLGLTGLLGTTWTLAFFSFGVFLVVQVFLFTILNALQGLFISLWCFFLRCQFQKTSAMLGSRSSQ